MDHCVGYKLGCKQPRQIALLLAQEREQLAIDARAHSLAGIDLETDIETNGLHGGEFPAATSQVICE